MEELIRLILAVFAVFRLSSLIALEEGLYIGWPKSERQTGIFEAIRVRLGAYNYDEDGLPEKNLGRLISCPLCVGFYVSVLIIFLMSILHIIPTLIILFFGVWGMQTWLERLASNHEN